MRIIKQGEIPNSAKAFWVGEKMTCRCCSTEFELEDGDKVEAEQERRPSGVRTVRCVCPLCGSCVLKLSSAW